MEPAWIPIGRKANLSTTLTHKQRPTKAKLRPLRLSSVSQSGGGHISLSAAERQIQSLTQSALGLFNQRVYRECPFMLRQWQEATANCLPIVSHCPEQGKLCELERSEEKSEREAVFIFQAFLSFPVRLCCLCVCEPALLSVGTINLRAWRATDVAGLYCCFPPAPTVPPLIHRESNPIIWQDTQNIQLCLYSMAK